METLDIAQGQSTDLEDILNSDQETQSPPEPAEIETNNADNIRLRDQDNGQTDLIAVHDQNQQNTTGTTGATSILQSPVPRRNPRRNTNKVKKQYDEIVDSL